MREQRWRTYVRKPSSALGHPSSLYFGIIRPFKGLEDLIRAFDGLPGDEAARYLLTIVGETWEEWDLPARLIPQSPVAPRYAAALDSLIRAERPAA